MTKHEVTIVADYAETTPMSLDEICESCRISPDFIEHLIRYDIIQPMQGNTYNLEQLRQIKTALRLYRQLEVNLEGVAIVLDLMRELHDLRAELTVWERHYLDR